TSLNIELRIFLLNGLQLTSCVDCDIPRARLLTDLLMLRFWSIDSQGNCNVEIRTLLKNVGYIRKDSLLNLSVRHDVDRFEFVVLIKRSSDARQVLPGEGFTSGQNQHSEISTQGLRNTLDLMCLHLQLFTRAIVQLVREEAMRAAHVANGRHQYIQQYG